MVIPDSVNELDQWAFCGCSGLAEVVIPDSVTSMGKDVFLWCNNLKRTLCSEAVARLIGGEVEARTIGCFYDRLRNGGVDEEEKRNWFSFISEFPPESLKMMKNRVDFCRSAIENGWVTSENVDEIIEITENLECRATLIEYKRILQASGK